MKCRHWKLVAVMVLVGAVLCTAAYAKKSKRSSKAQAAKTGEVERKVKEAQVPKAALKTLKKMARGAKITEFAEEIEQGHTFYEGSWKTRSGANMDVLVTKAGALVEIEQQMDIKKVPAAVLKAARKAAGKDAELACEKKTMILYEIKFSKNGGLHELLLAPDGRRVEAEAEKGKSDNGDDDKNKKKDEDKGEKKRKASKNDNDDDDSQKMKAKGKKKGDEGDDDDKNGNCNNNDNEDADDDDDDDEGDDDEDADEDDDDEDDKDG